MENNKLKALVIFEMLGRPREHLEETMKKLVETIGLEKEIKVSNKSFNDCKELEEKDKDGKLINKGLFSTFSELELEFNNIEALLGFAFKYTPAHLEIVYPENFNLKNSDLSIIISNILTRMHHYDSVVKSTIMQNQMLSNKIKELQNSSSGTGLSVGFGNEPEKAKPKKNKKKKN